jgi:hypothetical protein
VNAPPKDKPAHVLAAAELPLEWEMMVAEPLDTSAIPPRFSTIFAFINRLSETGSLPSEIISSLLRSEPPTADLRDALNAVTFLLPKPKMQELALAVTSDPSTVARLNALYPDDLAAQYALPALVRRAALKPGHADLPEHSNRGARRLFAKLRRVWATGRAKEPEWSIAESASAADLCPPVSSIGPELDPLNTIHSSGQFVSFPNACNILSRQSLKSRYRACVLATARNEGLYILEWLAHHKALGFEHFFIYTNNNSDRSEGLLESLARAGQITLIKNQVGPGFGAQVKAYCHALQMLPEITEYEWTLVIDLDEYLVINETFSNLADYLNWCERGDVDVIAFNWFVLGSNGETHWREAPMRARFPSRGRKPDDGCHVSPLIKSMFRTTRCPVSMPHHPTPYRDESFSFRTSSMAQYAYDVSAGPGMSSRPDVNIAQINHYFYKSNEEFLLKFSRSRGDHAINADVTFSALSSDFIRAFMNSANPVASPAADTLFDAEVDRIYLSLLALPNVQSSYEAVKAYLNTRVSELALQAAGCKGILEAGEAGREFLRPLLRLPATVLVDY